MFSLTQILIAAGIGGVAVLAACLFSHLRPSQALLSAFLTMALIAVWRVGANITELNSDFVPHISLGDIGCFVAGILAPMVVAFILNDTRHWWFAALMGGLGAFIGNVVILW